MSGQSKVHHGVTADSLTVLKPQKLGRHYHRIPKYITEVTHKYPRLISDYFLRNYRINIELLRVDVQEQLLNAPACIYRSDIGKIGFAIDRALLTEALECYYGGMSVPGKETPPVTTSEQRMRHRLGMDISYIFVRSLLGGEALGTLEEYENDYEVTEWEYVVQFEYTSHLTGNTSSIFIYLDTQLADELIARLAGPAPARMPSNPEDSIKHLPVTLECIVAAAQMPLSEVLSLAPNDVLLMRPLDRYEIRVAGQKLFRGTVFEEDGGLFLTSLESVKTP
ncbi:FliM/FliN family flagellar motor switch protein [Pseudomonas sp. Marseille-QA0892]